MSKSPACLILVENLPVPLDRRVWQEAVSLRDNGWRVTIISPRGPAPMRALKETRDGIEILRYPQRPATGLAGYLVEYLPSMAFSFAWLIWRRLRGPIDVIHGCNPPDLFWMIALVGKLWGAKYVFDQHDAGPELAATKFTGNRLKAKLLDWLTRRLEAISYRVASVVLAPNESYRQIATHRGRCAASNVYLVRNSPDLSSYRSLAANVTPSHLRVGYVGVMGSQDGLDLLVDAWAKVVEQRDLSSAVLELVGDGEALPQIKAQVHRLGIQSSVVFHGYRRPAEFVPVLARCLICVSPDPPTPFNNVSTMVKVLDYMAIGRAVVAFDLAETKLLAGEAAYIVKEPTAQALAETLIRSLRRESEMRAAGEFARQRAEDLKLDWATSAKTLCEAYAAVQPS